MSFWGDIKDNIGQVLAGGLGTLGLYNGKQNREKEREQRDLVNTQIKAYQDQTNLTKQQLDESRKSTESQSRRVQEKQIRSLRRNYRAQGLLGVGNPATQDMSNQLGG